jgi:hypothetical protein
LIWQDDEWLNLVEIKATETIMTDMFNGLNYFEKLLPDKVKSKTLVHSGSFNQDRSLGKVLSWMNIGD